MFRHGQSHATAIETAKAAQNGYLFFSGAPQFAIFCDGSSENTPFAQFRGDKGGYGVVFRDPYESVNDVDLAPNRLETKSFAKKKEDGWCVEDFVILNWLNSKVYSADHAEISALSQGLEEVIKRVDHFGPPSSTVRIFSDSESCQMRINMGILVGDDFVSGGNNLMSDGSNVTSDRERKRTEASFHDKHTNPTVRAIVWQSHYLFERGCTIEIHWMPRNLSHGHLPQSRVRVARLSRASTPGISLEMPGGLRPQHSPRPNPRPDPRPNHWHCLPEPSRYHRASEPNHGSAEDADETIPSHPRSSHSQPSKKHGARMKDSARRKMENG